MNKTVIRKEKGVPLEMEDLIITHTVFNEIVNNLYNTIDNKDKIINEQALEIARLRNWWSKTNVVIRREKELMMNENALLYITDLEQKIELLQNDLDGANSKLSDLMKSHLKAIEYITTEQLYTNYQWGKSQYAKILKDLLEILGGDKE